MVIFRTCRSSKSRLKSLYPYTVDRNIVYNTLILLFHLQDILKFVVIFLVVFMAFMVGLHNLYWYYPVDVRERVEFTKNNVTTQAEKHFGMYVFRSVYW